MKLTYLLLPALVALAACASREVTPTTVGDWHIGMPAKQVSGLDTKLRDGEVNDECIQISGDNHARLVMLQKGSVTRIDVLDKSYTTPEGIHVGSTEAEVKAAYGKRLTITPHKYREGGHYLSVISHGAGYVFETNGKTVTRIRVGKLPALNYVEGCA